jgi:acetylornithine deacetylase/succinyl-diaminopimelate desuccinylase-like protein
VTFAAALSCVAVATLLEELFEWLAIPSISTGGGDPEDVRRAAEWAAQRVRAAGGTADLVTLGAANPLVVGELRAARDEAPTVLIYGHYDVQGPGALEAWTSPPFDPTVRNGRIYARGAADDKGNFLPLLHVACELAAAGTLPVNVRVLIEGEEEASSAAVAEWIRADERMADCAIVFDSGMADEDTPAITLGLRGMIMVEVRVRTGVRDLHSGVYGGSALNALHVLSAMLAAVVPGPDGCLREELRAGVQPPTPAERESWQRLTPGDEVLAEVGGRPAYPGAAADYYARNGAEAALDVNQLVGGEPRTVLPVTASAVLSLRLAPGQRAAEMGPVLEGLLRAGAPEGAEVEIDLQLSDPSLFDAEAPALTLALAAIERATGMAPALMRTGGSIPAVAELAARGIPTVVTGFALSDDAFHAPDESYRIESLELGERTARELYAGLAELPAS